MEPQYANGFIRIEESEAAKQPHRRVSLFSLKRIAGAALVLLVSPLATAAQENAPPAVIGRWDLVVTDPAGAYPSWLEVLRSGNSALVGRFVSRFGSARPVSSIEWSDGVLGFAIPPQWEQGEGDLRVEARMEQDRLVGTIAEPDGSSRPFTGSRAPALRRAQQPSWGSPDTLFNGRDLTGWTIEGTGGGPENNWTVRNGVLTNTAGGGANLMTTRKFNDFKLHIEFRYPPAGNSGVYLRGRHEVQVEDNAERDWPLSTEIGGVYGFLVPSENASAGPGQWQTYDITLVGRRVTVVLNGKTVIADQVIPGITGGALDSDEGAPGPILLQGDHTAVEYRNIVLSPAITP
jgi:hypothetical protein